MIVIDWYARAPMMPKHGSLYWHRKNRYSHPCNPAAACCMLWVRVKIMAGSQKCRIVGKSQSVLIMINPIIFTRTRICPSTDPCV
jgi:hypothetical protein